MIREDRFLISRKPYAVDLASLRGKVPAYVIAEALEEKARREGRPLPPSTGGTA